ncbi:hypothetical protein MTsN4n12_27440 [Microbacterium sp. MTN4-12]
MTQVAPGMRAAAQCAGGVDEKMAGTSQESGRDG